MAAAQNMMGEEEFLIERDFFRRNAFLVIQEMVVMLTQSEGRRSELVDEILHSIFFLGRINAPRYTPEYIVPDDDMLNRLRDRFPEPFARYSTELPRRSPISCVLDMIVYLKDESNEGEIIRTLQELILKLKEGNANDLVSSTICVSQADVFDDKVRYYGVSMSTSGRDPGRIMIAASCLSTWDSCVADAVMTYYPSKVKKEYFDRTIRLPRWFRCEAFNISDGRRKRPCKSCENLFGLETSDTQEWPYGHCAEAESLSNLFKRDIDTGELTQWRSQFYPRRTQNRGRATHAVMTELQRCLNDAGFEWNNNFYFPQARGE